MRSDLMAQWARSGLDDAGIGLALSGDGQVAALLIDEAASDDEWLSDAEVLLCDAGALLAALEGRSSAPDLASLFALANENALPPWTGEDPGISDAEPCLRAATFLRFQALGAEALRSLVALITDPEIDRAEAMARANGEAHVPPLSDLEVMAVAEGRLRFGALELCWLEQPGAWSAVLVDGQPFATLLPAPYVDGDAHDAAEDVLSLLTEALEQLLEAPEG